MDFKSLRELRFLGPGFNWMKIQGMIAVAVGGYDSPLPPGTKVAVETFDPGAACMEGPLLVARGEVQTAITTPPWFAKMALEGKGYFSSSLPLRALACFPHFDQLAFAVKKETGLKTLGEAIEKKFPLKISTAPPGHPGRWVIEEVLKFSGCKLADFERWGGKVTSEDRQKGRLEAVRENSVDAVFDEALMTPRWKTITDEFDFTFLAVDEDTLRRCESMGMERGWIPLGRLRGVNADVPTIDFAGWLLYCREDFPDEYAYFIVKAIDERKNLIDSLFQPGQGLTGKIACAELCRDTAIPLHPGAVTYYREKGYLHPKEGRHEFES
jgi:TRAP-type uncharacterized transport system substrate-binding protein